METVHHRAPRVVPSCEDWSRLRPTVTLLYRTHRWTMARVRDYLQSLGFRVNTRMIRARITQWNIQRNHQVRDMAAALRLLNPDPASWPSPEPRFLIRGRTVTVSEVLRFFRRKGVRNPFHWAWSVAGNGENSDVLLLDRESARETTSVVPRTTTPLSSSSRTTPAVGSSSLPLQIVTFEQRAIASLQSYCVTYVGLGHAAAQREPNVHQFTTHGRFGDRMQEGLAQMKRREPGAFPNFRRGFDLVQALLSDCHPTSLAQFLAVACEFAAHGAHAHAVLSSLLRYSATMATSLRVSRPVVEFLLALHSSQEDVLRVAISSLHAALGAFHHTAQQPTYWQRLYIQERLCDCLYHAKERAQGSSYRASLLRDQEGFYGSVARNVLWTLTNVADDQTHSGNLEGGKASYMAALRRAERLTGFGRAKIRFAALEGLSRVEEMRVEEMSQEDDTLEQAAQTQNVVPYLQEAYCHIDGAVTEASIWFDPSSRRLSRVLDRRRHISALLARMGHNPPTSSPSSSNPPRPEPFPWMGV